MTASRLARGGRRLRRAGPSVARTPDRRRRRTRCRTPRSSSTVACSSPTFTPTSLLWGRDLLVRGDRGHVDVPRLIEGGVALQAFAACVRVPRHLNLDANADTSDDVTLLALAGGWPRSDLAEPAGAGAIPGGSRAAHGRRLDGRFTLVTSRADLEATSRDVARDRAITAGLLTIEGASPLEGDPAGHRRPGGRRVPDARARPLRGQPVRRLGARGREGRPDRSRS